VCFKTVHANASGTGRGAWDAGRVNWEGEVPAEPKRQRVASGE
jgi:hypothetical protein